MGYIADPVGAPSACPVLPGSNSGHAVYAAAANSSASFEAGPCGSLLNVVNLPPSGRGGVRGLLYLAGQSVHQGPILFLLRRLHGHNGRVAPEVLICGVPRCLTLSDHGARFLGPPLLVTLGAPSLLTP